MEAATVGEPRRFDHLREHSIGLWQVLFQSITHMAPAAAVAYSIYISVPDAQQALPLSVALALIACICAATAIGQLAKLWPSAGGMFTYVARSLGPGWGFLVAWLFIGFEPLVAPFLYLEFGWAMNEVFQSEVGWHYSGQWWIWLLLIAIFVLALTYRDIRLSTTAGVILGAFEIAIFGALAIWMLISNAGDLNAQPFNPHHAVGDWSGVFKGMVFAILAFIGFEAAAPLGEEARNPKRTVPRAVVGSAIIIGLFYVLCAYAWVFGAGFDNFVKQATGADPWRDLGKVFWSTGWILVFLAICNSIAANSNAAVNAATRVFYALARNGLAPRPLARTHPQFKTPQRRHHLVDDLRARARPVVRLEVGAADRLRDDRDDGGADRDHRLHARGGGMYPLLPRAGSRPVQSAATPDPAGRRDRAVLLPALLPVLQGAAHVPGEVRELGRDRLDGARRAGHAVDRANEASAAQRHGAGLRRGRAGHARDAAGLRAGGLMAVAAGHRLSRDQVIWSFGPDLEPVLEVGPGDVVTFETNDCFTGQIQSEDDLVTEIDLGRINGATGPVAVRGAEPGDSLVAEILDVRPIEWGVATLIPGFGQLIDQVQAPLTRLFDVRDGEIRMNDRVSFPARPMVGVVGVATDGEELSNGLAGRHGGNLDDHLHGKGAKIFFPVRQPGGMFAVGDMHASMGDGEICFTGVEIAGEVDIRFDVLKGKQATWPVTELADRWLPHATADQFDEALAARLRGGGADARRRARLLDGGRLHLPLGGV